MASVTMTTLRGWIDLLVIWSTGETMKYSVCSSILWRILAVRRKYGANLSWEGRTVWFDVPSRFETDLAEAISDYSNNVEA